MEHAGFAKKQAYDARGAGRVSGEVPGTADYFGRRSRTREIQRQGAVRRRDEKPGLHMQRQQDQKGASKATRKAGLPVVDPGVLKEAREFATETDENGVTKVDPERYREALRAFAPEVARRFKGNGLLAKQAKQAGATARKGDIAIAEEKVRKEMGWRDYIPFNEPSEGQVEEKRREIALKRKGGASSAPRPTKPKNYPNAIWSDKENAWLVKKDGKWHRFD